MSVSKKTRMGWAVALAALVAGVTSVASAAELESRLDRHRVVLGETVELQLRLRDGVVASDITLLEADFAVVDVQRSSRTQIINGRRDDSIDWRLTLAPMRSGELSVPSLRAGDAASQRIALEVLEPGAHIDREELAGSSPPVLIETEVDDASPYVQGKLGLTVRVWMDERVLSGSLSEPSVDGAAVQRTGEDRRYDGVRNGRPYQVVERQYAIFPQRSGELVIPPVVFDGRARSEDRRTRRADPFGSMFGDSFFGDFPGGSGPLGSGVIEEMFGGGGRSVRTLSSAVSVDVKPRPDGAGDGWWLPARDVEIVEQWDDAQPVFRVGEPVNRSVAIRATGLSGAQLPPLTLPEIDGMKQYREPAVDDTATRGDEVISIRLQKAALVPTQPGTVTLPAIEIEWWDTAQDRSRTAVLPARRVEVLAAPGQVATASPPGAPSSGTPPAGNSGSPAAVPAVADDVDRLVRWIAATSVALGLVGAASFAWVRRRSRGRARVALSPQAAGAVAAPTASLQDAEARLRAACDQGDAGAALSALRVIGRIRWPLAAPAGAAGWGARVDSAPLEGAIIDAERARYAAGAAGWEGRALWQSYRAAAARKAPRSRPAAVLPDLYPTPLPRSG